MDIHEIENIDFEHLTSDQADELGLNTIFQERDGSYSWIYCMNMLKDLSMFKFVLKIMALAFLIVSVIVIIISGDLDNILMTIVVLGLTFGFVVLIIIFSFWLTNAFYKGRYMLMYTMNNREIIFYQTSDQAQITKTIAKTYAAVSAVGADVGGAMIGTGMAMRSNGQSVAFLKVKSVRGKRKDNLIWVNSFFQHMMVYVPKDSYDFVWNYITARCRNARISGE